MRWLTLAALASVAVVGALFGACESARANGVSHGLTLFGLGASEQFLDHSDDRARGEGNNPFGAFSDGPALAERGANGPYAGDQAVYKLDLFDSASLSHQVGSAAFSCLYNFNHNGYCDVVFELNGSGSLFGSGAFNFDAKRFSLAITGGLGKFQDARGAVEETPASNHAQRYGFTLVTE